MSGSPRCTIVLERYTSNTCYSPASPSPAQTHPFVPKELLTRGRLPHAKNTWQFSNLFRLRLTNQSPSPSQTHPFIPKELLTRGHLPHAKNTLQFSNLFSLRLTKCPSHNTKSEQGNYTLRFLAHYLLQSGYGCVFADRECSRPNRQNHPWDFPADSPRCIEW